MTEPESESEAEAEAEDDGEPATALPGFEWNPIMGVGGVGALAGDPDPRRLIADAALGEVWLRIEGRPGSTVTALLVAALALVLNGACVALSLGERLVSRGTPWGSERALLFTVIGLVFLAPVLGVAIVSRLLLHTGEVLVGERGIAKRSGGKLGALLPWEDLRGYRADAPDQVALLFAAPAEMTVPTPRAEDRERLIRLLDERGVPRLD